MSTPIISEEGGVIVLSAQALATIRTQLKDADWASFEAAEVGGQEVFLVTARFSDQREGERMKNYILTAKGMVER